MVLVEPDMMILAVTIAETLVSSARDQLNWNTIYDPAYVTLRYPSGDVPKTKGVCTDVIIRSFRSAGFDLQKLIHEDKRKNPSRYPKQKLDSNIDHRRMRNQMAFFGKFGSSLSNERDWKPGDVVCWVLDSGRDHTGLVTDRRGPSGNLMVIHNLSRPREEDCLKSWRVIGHYRFPR